MTDMTVNVHHAISADDLKNAVALLVSVQNPNTLTDLSRLRDELISRGMADDAFLIICVEGVTIETISEEMMNRAGWHRHNEEEHTDGQEHTPSDA